MIFVVQDNPVLNFSSATRWGKLQSIFQPRENLGVDSGWAIERAHAALRSFGDDDYLILSGDPVAIGLCVHLAAAANAGRVQILKWDRQEKLYYEVALDFVKTQEAR